MQLCRALLALLRVNCSVLATRLQALSPAASLRFLRCSWAAWDGQRLVCVLLRQRAGGTVLCCSTLRGTGAAGPLAAAGNAAGAC